MQYDSAGRARIAPRPADQICRRTCCATREVSTPTARANLASRNPVGAEASIENANAAEANLPSEDERCVDFSGLAGARCGSGISPRQQGIAQRAIAIVCWQQPHAIAADRQASTDSPTVADEPNSSPTAKNGTTMRRILAGAVIMVGCCKASADRFLLHITHDDTGGFARSDAATQVLRA